MKGAHAVCLQVALRSDLYSYLVLFSLTAMLSQVLFIDMKVKCCMVTHIQTLFSLKF